MEEFARLMERTKCEHTWRGSQTMDTFETLVRMEEDGLWMERQEQESTSQITPEMTEEEKQRLNWESIQFEGNLPSKAFANLRAKEIRVTRCAESVPVGNRTRI